jgi:glycosyltransferase involved in cell wall biosynthesis
MNQIPEQDRPQIFVRCLAQTIDPDDFVHVWGMSKWMSLYEAMVNEIPNIRVLATNEEMVAHMKVANWTAPLYNISGLAFGKDEVQSRVSTLVPQPWEHRENRVVFAARWDQEKQPDFYMDLIERVTAKDPTVRFALMQGGPLRSNNPKYIDRARKLQAEGKLEIHENLQKNEYYSIVANSRVLFNSALQDWTSNTVSEADALNTNVLYPAYRSFPETFANDHERLYVPWSLDDAEAKLMPLLDAPHKNIGLISNWNNSTIDRCIDIMQGNGEQWRRDQNDYRNSANGAKYQLNK